MDSGIPPLDQSDETPPTTPANSRLIAKPKKPSQLHNDDADFVMNIKDGSLFSSEDNRSSDPQYVFSSEHVSATPAGSSYDEDGKITDKDLAIEEMHASGNATHYIASSVKNDISFFWSVYRIEQSVVSDDLRIQYVNRFMAQEALKLLGAVAGVVLGSLCIAGVLCFPMHLVLGALITSIAALYAGYKIYQHVQGYMQDDERGYTPLK